MGKSLISICVACALVLANVSLSARTEGGREEADNIRKTAKAEGLGAGDSETGLRKPVVRTSSSFEKKSGKSKLPYVLGGLAAGGIIVALLLIKKEDSKPKTGTIQVNSTPTGARILFNGTDTGKVTNAALPDISPGTHAIKVVKEGYIEREEPVTVTAGQTATVNFTLPQHSLTVTSPVQGDTWVPGHEFEIRWTTGGSAALSAVLAAGSRLLGPTSPQHLLAAHRAAALERPGSGRDGERQTSARGERPVSGVRTESPAILSGKSIEPPAPGGEARSFSQEFSEPSFSGSAFIQDESRILILTKVGIKLFRGGSEVRTIVANTDNSGSYKWTIPEDMAEAADYKIRVFCADAPEVYGESPNFRLSKSGSIQVRSTPTGAKVYLNNNDTGKTTNCNLTDLPFGTHTVKISKDGYVDHSQSVDVAAGQVPTVDVTLTAYSIVVEAPAADMLWPKTRPFAIKWRTPAAADTESEDATADETADGRILALTHVRIELWKGSTKLSPDISSSRPYTPGTQGTFDWTPAASLADGHDYKIRVVAIGGTADGGIYGESATFSIMHWYDFALKWGNSTHQSGRHNSIHGAAFNGVGNIEVTDDGWLPDYSYQILVYTPNGEYLGRWGIGLHMQSAGNPPRGIAFDSSGNSLVVDAGNHEIKKHSPSRSLITKWGVQGSGNGQFNSPHGVALDGSGFIYVADTDNHRIQKFTAGGAFVTKWGSLGTGNGQFNSPRGVAIDGSGYVYVTDYGNHRIQKFTAEGTFVAVWGSEGNAHGQFNSPFGIAVDGPGNVYVTEHGNHRVQKFTADGTFLTAWGGNGSENGQFKYPRGIAVDGSGYVYVIDTGNYRVQKFRRIG